MSDTPTAAPDVNLDEDRPASFQLRGEQYAIRRVAPKRYATALRALDEVEKSDASLLEDLWEAQLDFIATSIDPADGGLERFAAVREREYDGLEVRDIRKLLRWIQEVHTGRPMPSGEASSPGPGSSEASSKAESGPVEVVRPT